MLHLMGDAKQSPRDADEQPYALSSTQWSVVLAAGSSHSDVARGALAELCEKYWQPLYFFVRRRGYSVEEAQDLTQAFFADILERDALKQVARERGRFRSFLLACLKNFLSDEWDKRRAQKRGGGIPTVSLDFTSLEGGQPPQAVDNLTPEKLYERQWALAVLDQALKCLEQDYASSGKAQLFEMAAPALTGGPGDLSYRQIGEQLGLSEGAVKVAVHRLRKRYRKHLIDVISQTVGEKDDVEDELRQLMTAVSE